MTKTFSRVVALAVFLSASPVLAQEQARPVEVVVQAPPAVSPKVARHYVASISAAVDGQLTRFSEPVCPRVIGFTGSYGDVIVKRIREIADAAGADVAPQVCHPNINIVFVDDGTIFVKEVRAKLPWLFDGVDDTEFDRALRPGPVHAWNSVELRNEDGQPASGGTMYVKTASIIDLSTQHAIVGSMIVIEKKASIGKTLSQLADYSAMRALAGARPPRSSAGTETILALFDPDAVPPPAATLVDRSYLKGLYSTRPTARGMPAMGRIARQITRDSEERTGKRN